MKLYLLRHGDAEIFSSNGDRSRVLTEEGMAQSKVAGRYLKNIHPSVVLLSTYVRAKETLTIVNREGGSCALREFISMDVAPNASVDDLMVEINEYKEDSVLVVGHNPQLSNLIYDLTGQNKVMGNCSFAEIDLESNKLLQFIPVEDMSV
ncbi:phosphohistidine phosphatase SixA [Thiospirochaeta perfilievii]|uniref:Phosphohistidine phosphatase SixA n=1 Tax=Thiospirochaeta perfilievii TaxID=252967 RepID=A0A5C1QAX0_9SPIO|nr:phosphohistidine phosphatase SixA [Thiospirochaeta perfilievii]QEN04661.1 phosphohistidine phosphatase SixA [Thiospirochaeta perfilievii]